MSADAEFADFTAKYDMRRLEMDEAERVRAHQQRKHRRVVTGWVLVSACLASAVVGVAYIVWQGVAGPGAFEQQEQEARIECIEAKGVWIPGSKGTDGDRPGTCAVAGVLD